MAGKDRALLWVVLVTLMVTGCTLCYVGVVSFFTATRYTGMFSRNASVDKPTRRATSRQQWVGDLLEVQGTDDRFIRKIAT